MEKRAYLTQLLLRQNYSLKDALPLASQIAALYEELIFNGLKSDALDSWIAQDIAAHWHHTASFLKDTFAAYDAWFKAHAQPNTRPYSVILLGVEPDVICDLKNVLDFQVARLAPDQPQAHLLESMEFAYPLQEATQIADLVLANRGKRIGIVTNNSFIANVCANRLQFLGIAYNTSFPISVSQEPEADMVRKVSTFMSAATPQNLLQLLRMPTWAHRYSDLLLLSTYDSLFEAAQQVPELSLLFTQWSASSLGQYIACVLARMPPIKSERILEYLLRLEALDAYPMVSHQDTYDELLQSCLADISYTKPYQDHDVWILKPNEAYCGDFDLVFLSSFNHGDWDVRPPQGPWFWEGVRAKYGLYQDMRDLVEYYFTLLLGSQHVIVTRSLFKDNVITQRSHLWLKYRLDLARSSSLNQRTDLALAQGITTPIVPGSGRMDPGLPDVLYSSAIQLLIRNPFGFYARHVMNLRKFEDLDRPFDPRALTRLIRKALYLIQVHKLDPVKALHQVCHYTNMDQVQKALIVDNFAAGIGRYLTGSDLSMDTYVEKHGAITLDVGGGRFIKVASVAGKIEVSDNRARVVEFKATTLPTRADIESGVYNKLLVDALILYSGGFGFTGIQEVTISYVRFLNHEPFMQAMEVHLDGAAMEKHHFGLRKLLEYYASNPYFLNNTPKSIAQDTDDYWLLSWLYGSGAV